jgi:CHAT domain-containing protein/Tfp pilus assembly protein PilF
MLFLLPLWVSFHSNYADAQLDDELSQSLLQAQSLFAEGDINPALNLYRDIDTRVSPNFVCSNALESLRLANGRGILAWHQNDVPNSAIFHEEAKTILDSLEDIPYQDQLITLIGYGRTRQAGDLQAVLSLQEAVQLAEGHKLASSRLLGLSHHYLGTGYLKKKWYRRSKSELEKADGIWKADGSVRNRERLRTLNNLGIASYRLKQGELAQRYLEHALRLAKAVHGENDLVTANIFGSLAENALLDGRGEEAFGYYERALAIRRSNLKQGHPLEARTLANLGRANFILGDFNQAYRYFNQALEMMLASQYPRQDEVADIYNYLGMVQTKAGDLDVGRRSLEKSHRIMQKLFSSASVKLSDPLINLGINAFKRQEAEEARQYFAAALNILDKGNPRLPAVVLDLGVVAASQEKEGIALEYYLRSMQYLAIDGRQGHDLALTYHYLARLFRKRGAGQVSIFFSKLAVSELQNVRTKLLGSPVNLQKSFLESADDIYRGLSSSLLDARRIDEAIIVLNMLKEYEHYSYIGIEGKGDPRKLEVPFLPYEDHWRKHHADKLADLQSLSPNKDGLDSYLVNHRQEYELWLQELTDPQELRISEVGMTVEDQSQPFILAQGEAHLRYLVTSDKLYMLLRLPGQSTALIKSMALDGGREALSNQVFTYRKLILNKKDSLPVAQALHKTLLGPLENLLTKHGKVNRLYVSLDGDIRYLPLAALHDGGGYLVDRFEIVHVNASTSVGIMPTSSWVVTALGTRAEKSPLKPLLQVELELNSIVLERGESREKGQGVIPGQVLLDEQFSKLALRYAASESNAVHIASHFQLVPNNYEKSYLLLGDGQTLSLGEMSGIDFTGTKLLTLAACNTVMGTIGENSGREIDSLATLMAEAGAGSVLATLWSVSDLGTRLLMQHFYLELANGATIGGALTSAQRNILHGTEVNLRIPYYWAPFILTGRDRDALPRP